MPFSVGLVSFRLVWYLISVGFVLFNAAQCRIGLRLLSNCVGVVLLRVASCRISVGLMSGWCRLVSSGVGLVSDSCLLVPLNVGVVSD